MRRSAIGPQAGRVLSALGLAALVATCFLVRHGEFGDADVARETEALRSFHFPLYEATRSWVRDGQLPLWNPYHLAGVPWLASLQVGVFYPPHWLYLALPTHRALELNAVLHLVVIALSMAALARQIGVSRPAATLAACLLALRGLSQSWLGVPSALEAGAWTSLGCLGVVHIARGRILPGARWLGLAVALSLLAGHPQVTLLAGCAWLSLLWVLSRAPGSPPVPALRAAALALGLGLTVAAAQVLPSLALGLASTRGAATLSEAQLSPPGGDLVELLVLHGTAVGFVGLLLAPAAFFTRRRRRIVYWAGGLALACLLLAVAYHEARPLLRLGLGWLRSPEPLLMLFQLGIAVLAAIGFDTWRRRVRDLAGRPVSRGLVVGFFAVLALDLTLGQTGPGALPYDEGWLVRYRVEAARLAPLAQRMNGSRAVWIGGDPPASLKLGSAQGVRWLDERAPLLPRRQVEYFGALSRGLGNGAGERRFTSGLLSRRPGHDVAEDDAWAAAVASRRGLLDLAVTRYFVAEAGAAERRAVTGLVAALELVAVPYPDPDLVLFENPRVKPRAFVTYRATPAPSSEALLESLAAPDFDPLAASFVDDHAGLGSADAPRGHAVSVVRDAASEVELEVEAAALGLVVLADAHAGGWRARVDGEPARILVANHLYRGVVVPPGRHRVSFHYAVPGLGVGLVLSILGIAALVGLGPLLHRTLLRSGYHAGDPIPGKGT